MCSVLLGMVVLRSCSEGGRPLGFLKLGYGDFRLVLGYQQNYVVVRALERSGTRSMSNNDYD